MDRRGFLRPGKIPPDEEYKVVFRGKALRRLLTVAFWSVIAAAFIGPGTVTTAASAGAGYGPALLWALVFSTVACFLLQEASARLTVISGLSLGEALRNRFRRGFSGAAVLVLVLGAIVLGCAAYEAGNLLGGVAGAVLAVDLSPKLLTLLCGSGAAVLLWLGAPRVVALVLSLLVAVMGLTFTFTALALQPDFTALLRGSLLPSFPSSSGLLVLGLVGTTVVPYNLFLGSGLAKGQRLEDTRFGLAVAVGVGGLISMAVVVVGAAVEPPMQFEALAQVLGTELGSWAGTLFAVGLLAAGFSSAVTAPMAAAITARGLFGTSQHPELWSHESWRYRVVWGAVLAAGVGFGFAGISPIPAIILAQAFNGVLLPFVAIFLLLAVNDRRQMGKEGLNGLWANLATSAVVFVALVLGAAGIVRAGARALDRAPPAESTLLALGVTAAAVLAIPVTRRLVYLRRGTAPL